MPKALRKENIQFFFFFFRICFTNPRQKYYSKTIIGREILLLALWGCDAMKPCTIIYETDHGPALQSLGVKGVYEFPRNVQYLKKIRPKMFSLTLTLGYILWKKNMNHSELIGLNRYLIHLPLKSLDRILKQKPHLFNFICLPKFVSEEAKAKAKGKIKQQQKKHDKTNCPKQGEESWMLKHF